MAATRLIAMHVQKHESLTESLKGRLDYAKNEAKTDDGRLVSSYECDPATADKEFLLSKNQYEMLTGRKWNNDIIAYQIRQSFKPGEITAEEANRLGYETAMRWTKGKHAFVVATHIDHKHIHNHIIYNSTTLDCKKKFKNFSFCGLALQKLSDRVCLENGYSIIDKKNRKKVARENPYHRKNPRNQEKDNQKSKKKLEHVIDIQEAIAAGKGPEFERWAKLHNVKQLSESLVFMKSLGIETIPELCEKADEMAKKNGDLLATIKSCEAQYKELKELKIHIINYMKTKDIYAEYRKGGYKKAFFEEHRAELTLHKAAKEAFGKVEGPIPKVKEINEKLKEIEIKKRATYAQYNQIKDENRNLQMAKYNLERFKNQTENEEITQEKNKKRDEQNR